MHMTEIEVICEVSCSIEDMGEYGEAGTRLCFQKCLFRYDSGIMEKGYRFIRCSPGGIYHTSRWQACIPTITMAKKLLHRMEEEIENTEGRYSRRKDGSD